MRVKTVQTGEILKDEFFRFSSPGASETLRISVSASGVETPLRGIQTEGGFRLMAGFRRLEAALQAGLTSVPLVTLSDERPLKDHYLDVLLAQNTIGLLNLIEKSRAIAVLDKLGVPGHEQALRFAPVLSLPSNEQVLLSLKRVLLLPVSVQNFIEIHGLSLRQCEIFFLMQPESQKAVVSLGQELGIKGLELAEMARILHGISVREKKTVLSILQDPSVQAILGNSEMTRSQRTHHLRSLLESMQNPYTNRCGIDLDSMRKRLGPASAFLKWDPELERPGVELHGRVTSLKDVDTLADCFSPEKRPVWKDLLEIL